VRLALAIAALALAGCRATTAPAPRSPAEVLPGTTWRLVALDGLPVEGHAVPVLVFRDGTVHGDGGCNRYSAGAELEGDEIRLGKVSSTRRACEPRIQDLEDRYLELLGTARRVELLGEFLAVHCDGSPEPLRFAPDERARR
jgi:heat shock protein HslJ